MASKQAIAKKEQGYVGKAVPTTCANCKSFLFNRVMTSPSPEGWYEDKNLRCGIGGFSVKKMGSCNEFKIKEGE